MSRSKKIKPCPICDEAPVDPCPGGICHRCHQALSFEDCRQVYLDYLLDKEIDQRADRYLQADREGW
jgi:hypothetical protein